ncbi:Hypothetical predicted protein [Octopus vulgaris]|uniref:Uncharacterized protein n=1 Tax=Octopus vulgaris TaxID=6645 RepID=A0AA36F0L3_OCTVU|nr:Hypothetical predicted protein [Octopus vulgaris]
MSNKTQRKTTTVHQIACPMVNMGARLPGESQPEDEKSSTGKNSSLNTNIDGHLNGRYPYSSPRSPPPHPPQKEKWKRHTRRCSEETNLKLYRLLANPLLRTISSQRFYN